jgi:DnaJ domain
MKDYYNILEVPLFASVDTIKEQYHLLLFAWHPDRYPDTQKAKAEAKTREIIEAYKVLSNPETRKAYDARRQTEHIGEQHHQWERAEEERQREERHKQEAAQRHAQEAQRQREQDEAKQRPSEEERHPYKEAKSIWHPSHWVFVSSLVKEAKSIWHRNLPLVKFIFWSLAIVVTVHTISIIVLDTKEHESVQSKKQATVIDGQNKLVNIETEVEKEASSQHLYFSQKIGLPKKIINWEEFDVIFIKGDKLSYAGYEVEKSLNSTKKKSVATIKKNGVTLVSLESDNESKHAIQIGLFPLLGKEIKQLIIQEWTGGPSCCYIYKIYELIPTMRLIFDGIEYVDDYALRGTLQPIDFHGKGKYDIIMGVGRFMGFDTLCQACSPVPHVVFSYDSEREKFVVSNKNFSSYILRNIEKDISTFEEIDINTDKYDDYLSKILKIILDYIYAGKEEDGWLFYNSRYRFSNKEKIRQEIIKKLTSDPIYKAIYAR